MQHLVGKWKVVWGGGCGVMRQPAISSVALDFKKRGLLTSERRVQRIRREQDIQIPPALF